MPTTVAFFDLDYTILDTSSGFQFTRAMLRAGRIGLSDLPYLAWLALLYYTGRIDYGLITALYYRRVWPEGEAALQRFTAPWVNTHLVRHITAPARARIDAHRQEGHRPVILSAATAYVVGPVARHLGFAAGDFLCTRLGLREGKFDGTVEPPTCYGEGKIVWAERWAASNQIAIDWSASYFYTDSRSDLPLLRRVGNPIAVNPDRRLRHIAQTNGWPIYNFY
jgi:putative phosphoserine phosphatase / 1-acylglycerol-3-phosphate O-acyltransferase